MSNPEEGQVSFEADGKTWTLELTIRAERALQQKMKCPMGKLIGRLADGDVNDMAAIFHAGLQKHHPNTSEDTALDLVKPLKLRQLTIDLIKASYPSADEPPPPPPLPNQGTPETGSAT